MLEFNSFFNGYCCKAVVTTGAKSESNLLKMNTINSGIFRIKENFSRRVHRVNVKERLASIQNFLLIFYQCLMKLVKPAEYYSFYRACFNHN